MISYICYTSYFLILCAVIQASVQRDSKAFRNVFIFLTFGVMLLMMALRRFDVGNDTSHYLSFYHQIGSGYLNYNSRFETGFRNLTILINQLSGGNDQVFIAACVILSFIPYFILLYKGTNNLFFCIAMFWVISCTNIASASRQGIAIGLISIGYIILRTNKRRTTLLYLLFCVFASMFHTSAIIMIIVPFLRRRKVTIRAVIILIILTVSLTATNLVEIIFSRYVGNYYILYSGVKSGWSAAIFNMLLGVAALVIEYYSISQNERNAFFQQANNESNNSVIDSSKELFFENNFFRWSSLLYSACCILSVNNSVLGREATYFDPFLIIYISNHISDLKNKKVVALILILSRVGYSILALIIRPEWNSFFPFYYFWQK